MKIRKVSKMVLTSVYDFMKYDRVIDGKFEFAFVINGSENAKYVLYRKLITDEEISIYKYIFEDFDDADIEYKKLCSSLEVAGFDPL